MHSCSQHITGCEPRSNPHAHHLRLVIPAHRRTGRLIAVRRAPHADGVQNEDRCVIRFVQRFGRRVIVPERRGVPGQVMQVLPTARQCYRVPGNVLPTRRTTATIKR